MIILKNEIKFVIINMLFNEKLFSDTDFRACSSAGRAPRSQRGGRRFDPDHVQIFIKGPDWGFFNKEEICPVNIV